MVDITPENVARMLDGVTPGPWEAEGPEHSTIIWGYADRDDREYRVCFMTSDGPAQANARFIAWAREAVPALSARLAEVEASIRWVDEVYPSRIEAGGAGVEITWSEFNAMQKAIGVREDKRIGDQEKAASHNHRLRVARNEALARAEAAEAENAKLRAALLVWRDARVEVDTFEKFSTLAGAEAGLVALIQEKDQ